MRGLGTIFASVVQGLGPQPSKLMTSVRIRSDAPVSFLGSSVVEREAVNFSVGGSIPSPRAIYASELKPASWSPKPACVGAIPTGGAS